VIDADRTVDGLYLSIFCDLCNFKYIKLSVITLCFPRLVDAKGLEGVNWLKTAHLVGSHANMYGLTLHSVDNYIIVAKSMMPIAYISDKSRSIQCLALGFSLVITDEWESRAGKCRFRRSRTQFNM